MPSNGATQTASYVSLAPTVVTNKTKRFNSDSLPSEVLKVPDEARKRIPDSEHLTKMRAHILQAHQNSAFIKTLNEDEGIASTLVQQKLQEKKQTA